MRVAKVVPISALKNTGAISNCVHQAGDQPLVVTKNGSEDMVILSPELWHRMEQAELERRLLKEVAVGERALRRGEVVSYEDDTVRLRAAYGL